VKVGRNHNPEKVESVSHVFDIQPLPDNVFATVSFASFPSFPFVQSPFGCGFAALENPWSIPLVAALPPGDP
jgi:hypothetical protein